MNRWIRRGIVTASLAAGGWLLTAAPAHADNSVDPIGTRARSTVNLRVDLDGPTAKARVLRDPVRVAARLRTSGDGQPARAATARTGVRATVSPPTNRATVRALVRVPTTTATRPQQRTTARVQVGSHDRPGRSTGLVAARVQVGNQRVTRPAAPAARARVTLAQPTTPANARVRVTLARPTTGDAGTPAIGGRDLLAARTRIAVGDVDGRVTLRIASSGGRRPVAEAGRTELPGVTARAHAVAVAPAIGGNGPLGALTPSLLPDSLRASGALCLTVFTTGGCRRDGGTEQANPTADAQAAVSAILGAGASPNGGTSATPPTAGLAVDAAIGAGIGGAAGTGPGTGSNPGTGNGPGAGNGNGPGSGSNPGAGTGGGPGSGNDSGTGRGPGASTGSAGGASGPVAGGFGADGGAGTGGAGRLLITTALTAPAVLTGGLPARLAAAGPALTGGLSGARLPRTGAATVTLSTVGIALLMLGLMLVLAGRRRRG